MLVIKILVIALLGLLGYNDFRYKTFSWTTFGMSAFIFFVYALNSISIFEILHHYFINLIFAGFMLFLIFIYFWIRYQKFINIFDAFVTQSDVLFLVAISFLLAPVHFMVFQALAAIIMLFVFVGVKLFKKKEMNIFPIAGIQAALLILILIVSWIVEYNLYDDEYFLYVVLGR